MSNNIVTREDVLANMQDVQVDTIEEFGKKSTHVAVRMKNGFVLREFATPVDPANYDIEIGKKICLKKIEDEIWYLLGYQLQERMFNSQDPLKATAYQMFSPDYKERFKAECKQLEIRLDRLEAWLTPRYRRTDEVPLEKMHVMQEQMEAMDKLMQVYRKRADIENITI